MKIEIIHGDCLTVMPTLPENHFDSIVTDPPYGLKFMGKEWDHGIPNTAFWVEALRVAKPGVHLLAFGGTRTFHRLAVAIEDAGWEIRDCVMWVYGSGFPKSHNVGLRIDKMNGEPDRGHRIAVANRCHPDGTIEPNGEVIPAYEAKTEQGKQWQGWGTALKPAWEPIIVARKPLEGTVAANVLKWGTGAINVDGCRVEGTVTTNPLARNVGGFGSNGLANQEDPPKSVVSQGRWPANLIHDGSQQVLDLFPDSKGAIADVPIDSEKTKDVFGTYDHNSGMKARHDSGSAARFFYCAKASRSERNAGCEDLDDKTTCYMATANGTGKPSMTIDDNGNDRDRFTAIKKNNHPTVKPLALMRYLCRLVTPPGGTILDPFAGSGSTGVAAKQEGFVFTGIELSEEYCEIAEKRIGI